MNPTTLQQRLRSSAALGPLLWMLVCLAGFAGGQPAAAAEGEVTLVMPAHSPSKGTPFDVTVQIDSGSQVLGGYELRVDFDPQVLEFVSAAPGQVTGFTSPIRVTPGGIPAGELRMGAFQRVSRTLPTGASTVMSLRFRAVGLPGTSTRLDVSVLKLLTAEVEDILAIPAGGVVVINVLPLGDVNGDGVANQVSDAVNLTQALLGYQPLTPERSSASDVNGDGTTQTVADLVYLVNVLLGLQPPIGKQAVATGEPVVASLGAVEYGDDSALLPLGLTCKDELGAALLRLRLPDAIGELGEPRLSPRAAGMRVAMARRGSELLMLLYSLDGKRLRAGSEPVLHLPLRLPRQDALTGGLGAVASSELRLQDAQLSDAQGQTRSVVLAGDGAIALIQPVRLALHENSPNPFNPRTELRFDLPLTGRARLTLYDVAGRRVAQLLDRDLAAGTYRLVWEGTDARGVQVASGVYHARLELTGQTPVTRKLVLVR